MKLINKTCVVILSMICLFLVAMTFESKHEAANIEKIHKQEIFELRSQLDAARFDLQGATSHIEMLNQEREQK